MKTYRQPGASLRRDQQAAMYYSRKRRREREDSNANHSVLTWYKQRVGMQMTVTLQAQPA